MSAHHQHSQIIYCSVNSFQRHLKILVFHNHNRTYSIAEISMNTSEFKAWLAFFLIIQVKRGLDCHE